MTIQALEEKPSSPRKDDRSAIILISGKWINLAHAFFVATGFYGVLIVACSLFYRKIVKNEFYGYPDEFFPSVSAAVGDQFPARNLFHMFMALAALPRFTVLFTLYAVYKSTILSTSADGWSKLFRRRKLLLNDFSRLLGIVRCFLAGFWIFVTSSDHNMIHNCCMILYLLATLFYHLTLLNLRRSTADARCASSAAASKASSPMNYKTDLSIAMDEESSMIRISKFLIASLLGITSVLVYLFIQHKVYRVAGAYSFYALVEWTLVLVDIGLDYTSAHRIISKLTFGFLPTKSGLTHEKEEAKGFGMIDVYNSILQLPAMQDLNVMKLIYYICDVFQGYLFWTVVTSFYVSLWYFPLWELAFSGLEVSTLLLLGPGLLAFRFFRNFLFKFKVPLYIMSLFFVGPMASKTAIGPFSFDFSVETRFMVLVVGAFFFTIIYIASLLLTDGSAMIPSNGAACFSLSKHDYQPMRNACGTSPLYGSTIGERCTRLFLGLILSVIIKLACSSNNPGWAAMNPLNGGHHLLILFLGILSGLPLLHQRWLAPSSLLESHTQLPGSPSTSSDANKPRSPFMNRLASAVALGCIMYMVETYLTDGSLLLRWTNHGYPDPGPPHLPATILSILTMMAGQYMSKTGQLPHSFILQKSFFLVGLISSLLFYFAAPFAPYFAFTTGLVMIFYITCLFHALMPSINYYPLGFTLSVGFLLKVVLLILQLYTVAFAFVPFGWILRERSHVMILVLYGLLYWSIQQLLRTKNDGHPGIITLGNRQGDKDQGFSDSQQQKQELFLFKITQGFLLAALVLALLVRMSYPYYYASSKMESPEYRTPLISDSLLTTFSDPAGLNKMRVINAGIWTIHFGLDLDSFASHNRMADLITKAELDFVGLLESDTNRLLTGNRDLPQTVGELTNMYVDYGPSTRNHTWGCAFLSKYPIIWSEHHLLPSPHGELACAIHATVDVDGQHIDFLVSHNGQEEDPEDRFLQTSEIARIIKSSTHPSIFLGYVVTRPHEGNYHILMKKDDVGSEDLNFEFPLPDSPAFNTPGAVYDVAWNEGDRWCEYVGYRGPGLSKLAYGRIKHSNITDTEMQVGKFAVIPGQYSMMQGTLNDDDQQQFFSSPDAASIRAAAKNVKEAVKNIQAKGQFDSLPAYYQRWKFPAPFYDGPLGWRGHGFHTVRHFWDE